MKPIYTIMFWFSMAITLAALVCVVMFGLKLGVDFRGGSVLELEFKNSRPATEAMQKVITEKSSVKDATLSPAGDKGLIIRSDELSESRHQELLKVLTTNFPSSGLEEKKFDSVGPVIGNELKHKSVTAIIMVLLAVMIYIAAVFRKLSRTISGWAMGAAAIIALMHDVIVPMGVFAVLGHYFGIEISAVFVAAILTILGYSVSDTVVVFDRVRENVIKGGAGKDFGEIVHRSVMQTLSRSLNTTFTVLLSLIAIYLFGGESIKYFTLALIIGIFLGAYSSIFVASPLLVWWNKRSKKAVR